MAAERKNAVTLRGNPFTLVGPELKPGDKAPDFTAIGKDLKPVDLQGTQGKVRIFSVVPSLDTPVCDTQTRRFNQAASELPDVGIYTVSMDLPFAQSRWCAAAGVTNGRSEEHTSELQSPCCISYAVFCLDRKSVV